MTRDEHIKELARCYNNKIEIEHFGKKVKIINWHVTKDFVCERFIYQIRVSTNEDFTLFLNYDEATK